MLLGLHNTMADQLRYFALMSALKQTALLTIGLLTQSCLHLLNAILPCLKMQLKLTSVSYTWRRCSSLLCLHCTVQFRWPQA